MSRNSYDLSHYAHVMGRLGRLQTITCLPVLPGDSVEMNISGLIRFTPMRRETVQETQVDICAFYVPSRHVYPTLPTMLREGYDTSTTLTGVALTLEQRSSPYLGAPEFPATMPRHVIENYERIWDQYYRIPFLPSAANYTTIPTGTTPADENWRNFGRLCARLPHPLNNALRTNGAGAASWRDLSAGDADVASASSFDIRDLARVQGEYRSEAEGVWFTDRYRDLLKRRWGTSVNIDADQRPEMLWHETFNMSGRDVDGTGDANLGNFVAKTSANISVNIPRRYFPEHGWVHVLALARFPFLNWREMHPLMSQPVSYLNTAADPSQWARRQPEGMKWGDWLAPNGGSTSTEYFMPFGQHYRMHPNRIHPRFDATAGYPWNGAYDLTGAAYYYHQDDDYDLVFQSSQLAHWQTQLSVQCEALRNVPAPEASIFAGA